MSASMLINSRDSAMAFTPATDEIRALLPALGSSPNAARIVSCPCEKWDCGMCRSGTLCGREHEPLSATDARWPLPAINVNAPFHKDGAVVVAQDNVRVRLAAGTMNGLTGNKTAPVAAEALPTETYVGGLKTVQVGGREALLNHVNNAHTDGDTWVFFPNANVLATGDTFTNTGRYNTIDFANGGPRPAIVRRGPERATGSCRKAFG
jgi:hypothetical protein